jgi:hypothetical protein
MAKWYVVYSSRVLGVYEECGRTARHRPVTSFSGNCYKGYKTRELTVSKWRRHEPVLLTIAGVVYSVFW